MDYGLNRGGEVDMEEVSLKTYRREETGKGPNRRLRRAGMVPAVLYGRELSPLALKFSSRDFQQVLSTGAGGNVLIALKVEEENTYPSMIKEVQRDPLSDAFLHVDFQQISLTSTMETKVPLSFLGEPEGVKKGGILEYIIREVKVECLPTQIPPSIPLDISSLEIGQPLYVKDIIVPAGVKLLTPLEEVVVTVVPPAVEEEVKKKVEEEEIKPAEEPEGAKEKGKEEIEKEGKKKEKGEGRRER